MDVADGPVKEVKLKGDQVDWTRLPIPIHSEQETQPYVTAMNIVVDPETYQVHADGQLLWCEPATSLPMAQRYFLF